MNILIDECLPRYLKTVLAEYSVVTAQEAGWAGVKNGPLLSLAEDKFDVFITADQNLKYQQNLRKHKIAIVVFPSSKLSIVKRYEATLKLALCDIKVNYYIELRNL